MTDLIDVEIVYATLSKQLLKSINVVKGTPIKQVIQQSEIVKQFPEIDVETCKYGVFSRLVKPDYELLEGDRIEIYRALIADPKLARKKRAKKSKQ